MWSGSGLVLRTSSPVFGGEFPVFGGEVAGDVVVFGLGDAAHSFADGDGAGGGVFDCFLGVQDGLLQFFEPESVDGVDGFGHQALSLPGESEPEAAIDGAGEDEADGADDFFLGVALEREHPVPLFAAFDGG